MPMSAQWLGDVTTCDMQLCNETRHKELELCAGRVSICCADFPHQRGPQTCEGCQHRTPLMAACCSWPPAPA